MRQVSNSDLEAGNPVILATAENQLLLAGKLGQVSNSDYPGINVRSSTRQQNRGFCWWGSWDKYRTLITLGSM